MTDAAARNASPRAEGSIPSEPLPRRFGKYTLIRRMAAGGMAVLYLALHRSFAGIERLLVIKRILPEYGRDQGYIEMLLKEARIAMTFAHPNIVTVFDVGQVDGEYFIAMEHIHGEDLRAVVRAMKPKGVTEFPLEHALAIGAGVAAGLAYAHEKKDLQGHALGVVHRDISPQNIVVTFTGDVKVVDFGIAKARLSTPDPEAEHRTGSVRPARVEGDTTSGSVRRPSDAGDGSDQGKVKGKIPYMSPEQARGDDLDHRSDIFSLGIMLFELCTGRRLFRGTSDADTLAMITAGQYPRAAEVNPRIGPELDAVITRALAPDREERYQSARELHADLEAVARNERIPMSTVALGEWMKMLFAEQLVEHEAELADVQRAIGELPPEDPSPPTASVVPVAPPPPPTQRAPWVALSGVLAALLAGGAWAVWRSGRDNADARASAESRTGTLTVRSTPEGAHIFLDDAPTSFRTPHVFEGLGTGPSARYRVRITAEGYEPFTDEALLASAHTSRTIEATLVRARAAGFAVLEVTTTPPGARVLVDGREAQGTTPLTVPELAPSVEHTVVVRSPDHRDETFTFTGTAGRVETRAITLQERPLAPGEAWLELTTEPTTARVHVGDRDYSTGSPYRIRVMAQAHSIPVTVMAPGFDGVTRAVRLTAGGTVNLRAVRLAPAGRAEPAPHTPTPRPPTPAPDGPPGHLRVGANPWCNVTVDGHPYGQTPVASITLNPGSHRVVCASPDAPTRTRSVTLSAGQSLTVVFGAQ